MKEKSKKILKRIGAGLMLGLSLFNFSTSWTKSANANSLKRFRNLRKKDQEKQTTQQQTLENIAEEEARDVILRQQTEQIQQQSEEKTLSSFNLILRYAVIMLWAVSAGLFFSSVVFNKPVALGNKVLSLLPGIPHTANALLISSASQYQLGDEISIDFVVNSADNPVSELAVLISFDNNQISFDGYLPENYLQEKQANIKIEKRNGQLLLSCKNLPEDFKAGKIVTLRFSPTNYEGTSSVKIDETQSTLISIINNKKENILGKTQPAYFHIKQN